uniref:Uncharacterized protein n=1 Tax=uncultured bacterium BLR8 TaxID=506524 RepID=C0IN93_9BACT|nr:hypothetical protein AKSOIL_0134 [uncultured bacterium BLR8]
MVRRVVLAMLLSAAACMGASAADSLTIVFPVTTADVASSKTAGGRAASTGAVGILTNLARPGDERRAAEAFAQFDKLLQERGMDLRKEVESGLRCVGIVSPDACRTTRIVATDADARQGAHAAGEAIVRLRFNFSFDQGLAVVAQWIDDGASYQGIAQQWLAGGVREITWRGRIPAEVLAANRRTKDNAAIREYLLGGEPVRLLEQVREAMEEIAAMLGRSRELLPVGTTGCPKPTPAQVRDPWLGPPHAARTGPRRWMTTTLPDRCWATLVSVPAASL